MSEFDAVPAFTFKTRTNTELGAQSAAVTDDGSVLAWAYIYLGDADAFPLIPSGRWTGA